DSPRSGINQRTCLLAKYTSHLGRVSRIAAGLVGSGPQPDEDVGHTDRGLVADGELVEASGHRPELLATVHQPLHLIPGAVPVAVKGRRPPATTTPVSPVGLLIITLRDRVGDPAGPQRGPVCSAGIGLVPGQMIRSLAGPTPPTRPRHPHLVNQPDQLGGVGVLARVSRVARFRPRPSPMVWSLVVSPPRERPSACWRLAWIDEIPLCGPRRRAGGPGPPSSRSGRPSPAPQPHRPGPQRGLDPGPGAVGLPAREPLVDRLPGPIALGA